MHGGSLGATATLTAERDLLVGIGPFVLGLFIVAVLTGAVWYGIRLRRRESPPPRPEDQPKPPPGGPVGEVMEHPAEPGFDQDGRRLRPHELQPYGSTPGTPAERGPGDHAERAPGPNTPDPGDGERGHRGG